MVTTFEDVRCECHRLLFKLDKVALEIRCPGCKRMWLLDVTTGEKQEVHPNGH